MSPILQGGDDAQFVLRGDAGIDRELFGLPFEFGIGKGGELGAGQNAQFPSV